MSGLTDAEQQGIEELAAELCNTYYMTVDSRPERQSPLMYDKITEKTRDHWRAQARLLRAKGWRR